MDTLQGENVQGQAQDNVTEPKMEFNFGEWISDPKNSNLVTDWAEKTVAAGLKRKNDELLREKKTFQSRVEELEAKINTAPKKPDGNTYTDSDVERLIGERSKEWETVKSELAEKNSLLMGQINSLVIDTQLQSLLTKANAKPESVDVLLTFLKSAHKNGTPKIKVEESDGSFKAIVLDESGKPRFGKDGFMSLQEYVGEVVDTHKGFFAAPISGGSGATASQFGSGSRYKISYEDYCRLSSSKMREYKPNEVAPPAK